MHCGDGWLVGGCGKVPHMYPHAVSFPKGYLQIHYRRNWLSAFTACLFSQVPRGAGVQEGREEKSPVDCFGWMDEILPGGAALCLEFSIPVSCMGVT